MRSFTAIITVFSLLLISAQAAPTTDLPAGQESSTTLAPSSSPAPSATEAASQTTTATPSAPAAEPTTSGSQPSSSPPTTQAPAPSSDTSALPATSDPATAAATTLAHEQLNGTSSFTCYGRSIGYYADIERECKVYHFCLLGEYNGDAVYQRITYLCLKDTLFDQQALDCVEPAKMTSPCKDSQSFYETSNASLRQEIVGHKIHQKGASNQEN